MIAPAGHHCNVRSGHLNATFGGKDMGSMAQTGRLLVPSDALGHTWALPGVLGAGQGLPPETGPKDLLERGKQTPLRTTMRWDQLSLSLRGFRPGISWITAREESSPEACVLDTRTAWRRRLEHVQVYCVLLFLLKVGSWMRNQRSKKLESLVEVTMYTVLTLTSAKVIPCVVKHHLVCVEKFTSP